MKVEIIRDFEEFKKIRSKWNEALSRSSYQSVFMTYEWLAGWWEFFGQRHELLVILVYEGENLIAGAPLMIRKKRLGPLVIDRKLQFIAHDVSDYLDFILVGNEEESFNLILEQFHQLSALWDWGELIYLPESSSIFRRRSDLKKTDLLSAVDQRDVSVVVDLTEYSGWDEYFGRLAKKVRDDLKRQENNLSKVGKIEFKTISGTEAIKNSLETFFNLHARRWHKQGQTSQFMDPKFKARYLRLAELMAPGNLAEMAEIKVDGKTVASHFGFLFQGRYYYYTPTFDPEFNRFSPGKLLLANLLRSSFQRGLKEFDLLRGAEKYKFSWAGKAVELHGLTIFKKTMISRLRGFYKTGLRPRLRGIKKFFKGQTA